MVSVEFNRFISYYRKNGDLTAEKSGKRESQTSSDTGGAVRYFINIGSRDDFDWMKLKDFLKETLNLGKDDVFKVDVKEGFSFFNTEPEHQEMVMETLNSFRLEGRKINVEISQNDGGRSSGRRDHNGRGRERDRGERRERFSDSGRSSGGSRFSSDRSDRSSSRRSSGSSRGESSRGSSSRGSSSSSRGGSSDRSSRRSSRR